MLADALAPCQVCAVEISPSRVVKMQEAFKDASDRIRAIEGDAQSGEVPHADLVLALDVVEHFPDLKTGWMNLLKSGRYVYALIPKGRSWEWSEDHFTVFTDETIAELVGASRGQIWNRVTVHDEFNNSWYSLLVEGLSNG